MKTNRTEVHFEHSLTSMDYLVKKIGELFLDNFSIDNPWFIDHPEWTNPKITSSLKDPVDIVIFGSFLRRFFETGNWTHERYRLWVISEQVKTIYTDLLGIPGNKISVIPRSLIRTAGQVREFPKNNFDLVHSGRISPVKNIEFYLYFCHALQKEHNLSVRPLLFGDFDDITHEQHGRRIPTDYRKKINTIIEELDWNIKPRLAGLYPANEWSSSKELNNPVFTSFSTYLCEDFNVSLAQAEEKGWPCLLSSWGGQRDARASNIHHFPLSLIGESSDPLCIIKGKARALANLLIQKQDVFLCDEKVKDEKITLSEPITLTELDEARRSVVKKWGPETMFINREQMDLFADTRSGGVFFDHFKNLFGSSSGGRKTSLVFLDHNLELYPNQKKVNDLIEKICFHFSSDLNHVDLIPSREITHKENLNKILKSEKIIFPFIDEEVLKIVEFVKNFTGKTATIEVISDSPEKYRKLIDENVTIHDYNKLQHLFP